MNVKHAFHLCYMQTLYNSWTICTKAYAYRIYNIVVCINTPNCYTSIVPHLNRFPRHTRFAEGSIVAICLRIEQKRSKSQTAHQNISRQTCFRTGINWIPTYLHLKWYGKIKSTLTLFSMNAGVHFPIKRVEDEIQIRVDPSWSRSAIDTQLMAFATQPRALSVVTRNL